MASILKSWASLDARAISIFRRAVGGIVLLDLMIRATALSAHYTDDGILPRASFVDMGDKPAGWLRAFGISGHHLWSILFLDGSIEWTTLVFFSAACAALAMLFGSGRLATIFCWFTVASIQARNPLVNNGGDTLLRLLLFWCCCLPSRIHGKVSSLATAGLITQVAVLYAVTARSKYGPAWFSEGTALAEALSIESFAKPLGLNLLKWPQLLPWLTRGAWLIEVMAPLLLITPIATERARTIAVIILASLQIGIFATLDIGLFQAIALIALLPFLPSRFWDVIGLKHAIAEVGKHDHWIWVSESLAALALYASLAWNAQVAFPNSRLLKPPARMIAEILRVEQHWLMFSPRPPVAERGVIEFSGTILRDPGVALGRDGQIEGLPSAAYRSDRWRKLYLNLVNDRFVTLRPGLRRYLCGACQETTVRLVSAEKK